MSSPPALAALADHLRALRRQDLQTLGWLPLTPAPAVDAAPLDARAVGELMDRIDAAWAELPAVLAAWRADPADDLDPSRAAIPPWSADGLADTLPSDPTPTVVPR